MIIIILNTFIIMNWFSSLAAPGQGMVCGRESGEEEAVRKCFSSSFLLQFSFLERKWWELNLIFDYFFLLYQFSWKSPLVFSCCCIYIFPSLTGVVRIQIIHIYFPLPSINHVLFFVFWYSFDALLCSDEKVQSKFSKKLWMYPFLPKILIYVVPHPPFYKRMYNPALIINTYYIFNHNMSWLNLYLHSLHISSDTSKWS